MSVDTDFDFDKARELGGLELLARQVVEGFITGLHKSPFHGFSVEFSEHRLYNQGESIKDIDWKLFARTDKLFVKQFEEETNLRCQLVLDVSGSMYFPEQGLNKFTFSVYAAAAVIYMLRQQRDAFGLTLFTDKIQEQFPAKSSLSHQRLLFEVLEKMLVSRPDKSASSTVQVIHELAEAIHRRSMVMIFTDLLDSAKLDELTSALQHLRFNKHEVVLFHVLDEKHEFNFEYADRPHLFVDIETGERVKLQPHELKTHFKTKAETIRKELDLLCAQLRIDYVPADINAGFQQVLIPYLAKRGAMVR